MSGRYMFQISIKKGSPLILNSVGTLLLEINHTSVTGTLSLPGMFNESFKLEGSASNEIISGTRIMVSGRNFEASTDVSIFFINDTIENIAYVGGIVNILENDTQQWVPNVIEGSGKS